MKQLGKYEIIELLGSGATADVYRAHEGTMGRDVALKIFKPALVADAIAFARFAQEAQAAAGLFHENIATALDSGEIDGNFYIAMRYVPGLSLDRMLKECGVLPWDEALRMVQQISKALGYAHDQGFLHRDVKPANIICADHGHYVLTDFGLAKAMFSSGLTTHTGAVLGTPAYIPPEIWDGQEATAATDVYSLACVLYEVLTGVTLFTGGTPPAVMGSHFKERRFQARLPDGVPNGLAGILAKALAISPENRYGSAREFSAELTLLGTPPMLKTEEKASSVIREPVLSTAQSVQQPVPQSAQTPSIQQVKSPVPKAPHKKKTWLWILLALCFLTMFVCVVLLLLLLKFPLMVPVESNVPTVVQESRTTTVPMVEASIPTPTQVQVQPTSAPVTAGATVEVVDQSFYTDSYGDVQVYGLVKNNSDRAVSSIELTIEAKDASGNTVLKDSDGNTIATDTVYTMSSNLFPGETTPFTYFIDGDNGVPATVNVVASGSLSSSETRVNVTVENVEYFASDGSYYVSGELINNGSSAAKVEGLSAAIFDASNKVVAADWSYAYTYYLAPNGDEGGRDRTPFVVSIYGPEGDYSNYQVFIDAVETDFVAIPEIYVDLPYAYFGDWGSFHVIGTLENAMDVPYSVYLVTGLYAEDGTMLDAVSHSSPLYIAPGAKVAFDSTYFSVVGWEDAQTDKLDNYTVQLDPYWTYEAGYELVSPQTFTVTEARDGNAWNFSGEMTNDSGKDLSWMTLQVNVYDGETLVATEYYSMYPEGDVFTAGSKASYDLDLDLDPGLADVDLIYEIVTQGVVK